MSPGLDCVVVNFNAGDGLAHCVRDLLGQQPLVRVYLVDNASADGSLEPLSGLAGDDRLRVVRNAENRGFAAACNQGAALGDGAYLAFVNPDCRVPEGALEAVRSALEERPSAALAGALVRDPDGAEQRGTRRRLPAPWRALMTFTGLERWSEQWPLLRGVHEPGPAPRAPAAVEAVNGAFLVVRRADFESVGGFDEGYFLHCEDLDLFHRMREQGREILFVPVAVTHQRGTSSRSAPLAVHWHKHRSMIRYLWRHHARGGDLLWLPLACLGVGLRWLLLLPATAWRAARGGP